MKKYLVGAVFALSALSPLLAQASVKGLEPSQVDAIIGLLQSFGADQAVINNVQAALSSDSDSPKTVIADTTPPKTTVINSTSLSNIRANIPFSVSGTWSAGKSLLILVVGSKGTWGDSVIVKSNGTWSTVPFQNVPVGSYSVTVKDPVNLREIEKTSLTVTGTGTTPSVHMSQSSGATFPGETVTLWWDSENVQSCTVMKTVNGGTSVLPFGWTTQKAHADIKEGASENPSTIGDHVYTITCATSIGTMSKSVRHEVKEVPTDSDKTTADITQISNTSESNGTTGESVFLSWRSANATSCSLTQSINNGATTTPAWYSGTPAFKLNGSANPVLSVIGEHVFTFTCTGPAQSKSKSLKHTVKAIAKTSGKPTAYISQSPDITYSNGEKGDSFTLTWRSTDATSCTMSRTVNEGESAKVIGYENAVASGPSGTRLNGSAKLVPPLIGVRDYIFTCTGAGGTASSRLTHTVYSALPEVTLTQDKITTTSNGKDALQTFKLIWSSKNATSCSFSEAYTDANGKPQTPSAPAWYAGQLTASSTLSLAKIGTYVYTFTCSGPTGTASQSRTHTVTSNSTASALDALNSASSASNGFSYRWNRDLQIGSPYQDDVTALQTALTHEGLYTGEVTGGFYSQTYAAVKAFQVKYEIDATGYVGPATRAKLNELY